MQQPGRKFSVGSGYRYGFNGQEKSTEINEALTTAEYWEYDSRIGRRWNLDPKPTAGISRYSALGNSPIWYDDPLGDTLDIGPDTQGSITQSKEDITNLVRTGNQAFLTFTNDRVGLNFGTMSQADIERLRTSDKGIDLVYKLVNTAKKYLYEASDMGFYRNASGGLIGGIMRNDDNGVQNNSDNGLDANNSHTSLPRQGYNGQVIIDTKTTWDEADPLGNLVPKPRTSIVFHELTENYFRTDKGINYSGHRHDRNPLQVKGAHQLAVDAEGTWHGASLEPDFVRQVNHTAATPAEVSSYNLMLFHYIMSGLTPPQYKKALTSISIAISSIVF